MQQSTADRAWTRFSCPGCGGWLALPDDVHVGVRAERVARRIDAFVHRHLPCERRSGR